MSNSLLLTSLPLFPLGTVLFPGGLLPLRIFEVRYLDMIARCHKAGAPFGVVSLTQGAEVRQAGGGPESFSDVGTLAMVTELETPQPGLMLVRGEAAQRFRITSRQQLRHGLWIADVRRLDDDLAVPVPDDLQETARALGRLIESLKQRATPEGQLPLVPPYRLDDCGWVANRWCELLPVPLAAKQKLMELDDPVIRLSIVDDYLRDKKVVIG